MMHIVIQSSKRALKTTSFSKPTSMVCPADLKNDTKFGEYYVASTFGVCKGGSVKILKSGTERLRAGEVYPIDDIAELVTDHNLREANSPMDIYFQL